MVFSLLHPGIHEDVGLGVGDLFQARFGDARIVEVPPSIGVADCTAPCCSDNEQED